MFSKTGEATNSLGERAAPPDGVRLCIKDEIDSTDDLARRCEGASCVGMWKAIFNSKFKYKQSLLSIMPN